MSVICQSETENAISNSIFAPGIELFLSNLVMIQLASLSVATKLQEAVLSSKPFSGPLMLFSGWWILKVHSWSTLQNCSMVGAALTRAIRTAICQRSTRENITSAPVRKDELRCKNKICQVLERSWNRARAASIFNLALLCIRTILEMPAVEGGLLCPAPPCWQNPIMDLYGTGRKHRGYQYAAKSCGCYRWGLWSHRARQLLQNWCPS